MASKAFRVSLQTISSKPALYSSKPTRFSSYSICHTNEKHHLHLSLKCSLSSPTPPTSREEAILQAKTALSTTLDKPLNNPKLAGKLKKLKQPKLRVEVPVVDESPTSLSALGLDVIGSMPIKRKGGGGIKVLILWPSQTLAEAAIEAFRSHSSKILVQNLALPSVLDEDVRTLSSADVAVFLAPEESQLTIIKRAVESFYPKPVVLFNPKWSFEEESSFGELSTFVSSFDVVYSFTGLEVRGILSKRKGVVFKCVRDGVLSGEKWSIFVEEENGELRVVSRFATRPSIDEVENVLYNLMAANSPVTKSVYRALGFVLLSLMHFCSFGYWLFLFKYFTLVEDKCMVGINEL